MATKRTFAEAIFQEEIQEVVQRCEMLNQRVAYLADTLEDLMHRVEQMKINDRAAKVQPSESSVDPIADQNSTALDLTTCQDNAKQSNA